MSSVGDISRLDRWFGRYTVQRIQSRFKVQDLEGVLSDFSLDRGRQQAAPISCIESKRHVLEHLHLRSD